jgi:Calcineurin-like phosphoesterase
MTVYHRWVTRFLPAAIVTFSCILVLSTVPTATPYETIARDWAKYPAIAQLDRQPDHLYAIGDVHGDLDRLVALLVRAGLIDAKSDQPGEVHWTGGNSVLVLTGDMIDKGPHPVAVIRLLAAMRYAAHRAGGQVVVTMGNHEAEFLSGMTKTEKDPTKPGKKAVPKAVATVLPNSFIDDLERNRLDRGVILSCHGDVGEFLCSLPFAARVGDWFFSHAGNTAGRSISQLDQDLEQGVKKDGFLTSELSDPDSILQARLGADNLWFRPSKKSPEGQQTERGVLATDAAALGVSHMVQGHQPGDVEFGDGVVRHKGEMFQRWGLLFLIDTGLSQDIDDSKGAVLSISHGKNAVAICPDGTQTPLWDDAIKQDVGRALICSR